MPAWLPATFTVTVVPLQIVVVAGVTTGVVNGKALMVTDSPTLCGLKQNVIPSITATVYKPLPAGSLIINELPTSPVATPPLYQTYVPPLGAAELVRVTSGLIPSHTTLPLVPIVGAGVAGFTVIVVLSVSTIPFPSLMVTVYTVVTTGVAIGLEIFVALNPAAGLHE